MEGDGPPRFVERHQILASGYAPRMTLPFVIERLPSVDSTQSEARRRLEAGRAPQQLVLVADEQSAGRGRRGHTWHAHARTSLMFTAVLAPPELERPARFLLLVAVAAARALEQCGAPDISIKWPNDLFVGDRKLGGLIAEQLRGPQGPALLLGVGINLSAPASALPAEIARRATHAGLSPGFATRDRVLRQVLTELGSLLKALGTPTEPAWQLDFRRRSWLDGRDVEILSAGERFAARVASVSAEGDLLLSDGRLLRGEHVESVQLIARSE
ncbi:MAG: hypothetical protein DHS20C15_09770 [Planctomycetota bacterium]|nr:MAG: hypothetical protein DHS20C15_09770 [Planctomycetota bacterium]